MVSWADVRPPLILSRILEGGGGLPVAMAIAPLATTMTYLTTIW